ncbi:ChuX/HutX family heme-like substrate-binding protein [Sphingosinicella microcystinivorans]|uniref:ChuX/HutX family heme-like substrate-binding protein n=1 Tax=Sphingosinicella microcystinivorans TaxID=335406 RepID=UPI0022F3A779|nr:ChuX/HutX family heme-like substrate-binding protein [Sphingosinicella microcystinivorans]WBX85140.1 hypothetical protein PE061_04220 [Sphingosinicella microcystinivorans]
MFPCNRLPVAGAVVSALLAAACTAPADTAPKAASTGPVCADSARTERIRKEVKAYPGDPIAIVARDLELSEFTTASGLFPEMQVGALIDAQQFQDLWKSIESWGADTMVRLVISPSSAHAFIVHGKVPMIQPDADPGYLDVYADEGRGIHSHIQMSKIAAVYATDIPTEDPAFRTRGINFLDHDGHSVIGVYASIKTYEPDAKAVEGFERTRALVAALPRACP